MEGARLQTTRKSVADGERQQTGFAFYRPAALTVAGTLADAPLQMFVILIFCLIVYFMAGLYNSAGAFFTVSFRFLGSRPR